MNGDAGREERSAERFTSAFGLIAESGSSRTAEQLVANSSADIFQTELHYRLSGKLAQVISTNAETVQVLHNVLASKSQVARYLTAIAWFSKDQDWTGASLVAPEIFHNILRDEIAPSVKIVGTERAPGPYVGYKAAANIVAKAVVHNVFRLFSRPFRQKKAVVRSWVDVSLHLFPEMVGSAQFRVFPFFFSFRRQLRFVRNLHNRGIDWSLDGMPYSARRCLRVLFSNGAERPQAIAELEHDAYRKYGHRLVEGEVSGIYSSDEFEAGAITLGCLLRKAGIPYVNAAHGVGFYCPNVRYSEFRYVTRSQGRFYGSRDPELITVPRASLNAQLPLTRPSPQASAEATIVYVHQNFAGIGFRREGEAEASIIDALQDFATRHKATVALKAHPNFRKAAELAIEDASGIQILSSWSDISRARPVFILINSTAFYEVAPFGPVLVYKAPTFEPQFYLEGHYIEFDENNLEERLVPLLTPTGWLQAMGEAGHPC